MIDKASILTTIFTIVDDAMKGSAVIQKALQRPSPAPHLSDSEIITVALYKETLLRSLVGLCSGMSRCVTSFSGESYESKRKESK